MTFRAHQAMQKAILSAILAASTLTTSCNKQIEGNISIKRISPQPTQIATLEPLSKTESTPTPLKSPSPAPVISDAQILAKIKEILAASKTMDRDNLSACGSSMRELKTKLQPIRDAAEASAPTSITRTVLAPIAADLGMAVTCNNDLAGDAIKQVESAVKDAEPKIK